MLVHISTLHKKMNLNLYHYIIQNGVNYISIKHYGKSWFKKIFSNIVYIMSDLENCYKLNRYFYMDSNQNILKYKKYCIISDCEKNASFNYKNERDPIYCNTHKLNDMVNVKRLDIDKYNCLLCNKYIPKDHYFSKEHINNFENNISIKTKDSIKKKFVDLIIDFYIIDKNVFYKDLYFKDYLKN